MASSRLAAILALSALLAAIPASSSAGSELGRWDELGEDGRVWVPTEAPSATYLPGPDLGAFHNASEAVAALQALAAARPDLLTIETVGASVQGRALLRVTLTAPGDTSGRARVLFDGAHHGDEVIGSEILIRFLARAVAEYDTNATMRALLAQTIVDVVPMVNPDGIDFVPSCTHYAQCRKNARGVDLNRNYPSHWGEPGSSGNPGDATYRGPSPASEPETRVIRDLLDQNAYALYASLHSGAEMILWPYGWTTTAPPEASVYNAFGGELSALTGAPHGQVSRILYTVSGDSMDQAYATAAGWRPIAISPETYKGTGDAFNWWFLFNPAETEASIAPVVARWDKFLWHMVQEAPNFAPAHIQAPSELTLGPDAGELSFVVTGPARRPLMGASLRFDAAEGVDVLSPNPVAISTSPHAGAFTLLPTRGGSAIAALRLDAGPAGLIAHDVVLQLSQVALTLTLDDATLESPDTAIATLTLDAGPFARVVGSARFDALPEGAHLGDVAFDATPGAPSVHTFTFPVATLSGGTHTLRATATFNATDGHGTNHPGLLRADAPFQVLRPQVDIDKRFPPATTAGNAVSMLVFYRSNGTFPAHDLVVRESVPAGYAYWTRDGPVPIPVDPLGRPQPTRIEPRADGGVDLVYELGTLAPGAFKTVQYRMLAIAPGTHALPSAWTYEGAFASATVDYAQSAAPMHTVRAP